MEKAVSHSRTHYDTRRLVRMAVLVAIIFLLAFTPLGYLVIGPMPVRFWVAFLDCLRF